MNTIARLAAENAIDALAAVATAAGFTTDPTVVEAPKDGVNPADGLWAVTVGAPKPRTGAPELFEEVNVPVYVECYHCPTNADPRAVSERLSQMAGDVRRKLMEDPHRGNHAIYTQFNAEDDYFTTDPPFCVRVTATIWIRHLLNNPYSDGG